MLWWKKGERSHVHEYFEWIYHLYLLIVQGTAKGKKKKKTKVCILLEELLYFSFSIQEA